MRLHEDPTPLCDTPAPLERFKDFTMSFRISEKTAVIARVLDEHPNFRRIHSSIGAVVSGIYICFDLTMFIVPERMSYHDFWTRYFFFLEEIQNEPELAKVATSCESVFLIALRSTLLFTFVLSPGDPLTAPTVVVLQSENPEASDDESHVRQTLHVGGVAASTINTLVPAETSLPEDDPMLRSSGTTWTDWH